MSAESSPAPAPSPRRRRSSVDNAEVVLLVAAVALMALSLLLPWWSESQANSVYTSETSTWDYSPITGVTGTCLPACSPPAGGPPVGPFQGTRTFGSLGLNETATLYGVALGLGVVGMASAALVLAVSLAAPLRARLRASALLTAIVGSSLASGLVASLQPVMLRMDNAAVSSDHGAWTAAPSPETSFWGSCSPGPANGICTSGWSVSWGPGVGWYMIGAAALVLMAVALLPLLRARRSRAPAAPTERKGNLVDPEDASSGDVGSATH